MRTLANKGQPLTLISVCGSTTFPSLSVTCLVRPCKLIRPLTSPEVVSCINKMRLKRPLPLDACPALQTTRYRSFQSPPSSNTTKASSMMKPETEFM